MFIKKWMDVLVQWIFTNHWHIKDVSVTGLQCFVASCRGYSARDPMKSVEFVDTPDTVLT